jgi:hypothetical protein
MNAEEKLAVALWEADRHLQTLQEALNEWDADPVTGWEALDADRSKVRLVDQLLFRFTKLQDTLGERLIPTTLAPARTFRSVAHARPSQSSGKTWIFGRESMVGLAGNP